MRISNFLRATLHMYLTGEIANELIKSELIDSKIGDERIIEIKEDTIEIPKDKIQKGDVLVVITKKRGC